MQNDTLNFNANNDQSKTCYFWGSISKIDVCDKSCQTPLGRETQFYN